MWCKGSHFAPQVEVESCLTQRAWIILIFKPEMVHVVIDTHSLTHLLSMTILCQLPRLDKYVDFLL